MDCRRSYGGAKALRFTGNRSLRKESCSVHLTQATPLQSGLHTFSGYISHAQNINLIGFFRPIELGPGSQISRGCAGKRGPFRFSPYAAKPHLTIRSHVRQEIAAIEDWSADA